MVMRTNGALLSWREGRSCEAATLIPDRERAIEPLMDFDGQLGVAAAAGAGENLQTLRADRDGVVIPDPPLVLEAPDRVRIEPGGPGPVG